MKYEFLNVRMFDIKSQLFEKDESRNDDGFLSDFLSHSVEENQAITVYRPMADGRRRGEEYQRNPF